MTYSSGGLIQATDYNGFVSTNAANINGVWNTSYGQTALSTVATAGTITATQWSTLNSTLNSIATHQGTSITARTNPVAGNVISVLANLSTDITSVNTNQYNAGTLGTQYTGWTGTASRTSSTGNGTGYWTIFFSDTVTFANATAASNFFNAGGLVKIQFGKSSTGSGGDSTWNTFAGSTAGTIYLSSTGASKSLGGTSYTGTTKIGGSGSPTTLATGTGFAQLTTGNTTIFKQFNGSDYIQINALFSGSTLTLYTDWYSAVGTGTVSGGTASSGVSLGTAPTTVVSYFPPETTNLTNVWGTPTVASTVSVNEGPNPVSAPGAPTIGTATATGQSTATVSYTAPASDGGNPIQYYTATSSPGGLTGTLSTAGSGTITVSGLTASTSYTFTVTATNGIGTSSPSSASNSITTSAPPTCAVYTTPGNYTFTVPSTVSSVKVVAVGAGGRGYPGFSSYFYCCYWSKCMYSWSGGGGGSGGQQTVLNAFAVTPSSTLCVQVGATGFQNPQCRAGFSNVVNGGTRVAAFGGTHSGGCSGAPAYTGPPPGGSPYTQYGGGGQGGNSGGGNYCLVPGTTGGGGGGGAGSGGRGGQAGNGATATGSGRGSGQSGVGCGSAGGGAGGAQGQTGYGGGGVGIYGTGPTGGGSSTGGIGGSSGQNGGCAGGNYGGGGGGGAGGNSATGNSGGGSGGIRITW